ncbi:hypothetical protein LR48_Vigan03g091800 [Vigna angularis]|uniref:Uncharacterized protein n=1 Tax=Phaseolus angularis TaxID=3914 RepID=A0A0L9U441_PHAAN|nr:hypothetical protein LR48_Vigan03g091800 [Vigna angularis]
MGAGVSLSANLLTKWVPECNAPNSGMSWVITKIGNFQNFLIVRKRIFKNFNL